MAEYTYLSRTTLDTKLAQGATLTWGDDNNDVLQDVMEKSLSKRSGTTQTVSANVAFNGDITGTAVSTTGAMNKLVKTDSNGAINLSSVVSNLPVINITRDDNTLKYDYMTIMDNWKFFTDGDGSGSLEAWGIRDETNAVLLVVGSSGNLTIAGGVKADGGYISLQETTTPSARANYGKIYTKTDNKLYVQTGDGVEHRIAFV